MTTEALTHLGRVLTTVQDARALTDLDVVEQLNLIQSTLAGQAVTHRPIDRRTWQYWKHGRKEPRPLHLRVLASWVGNVPVGLLKLGQITVELDGSIEYPRR